MDNLVRIAYREKFCDENGQRIGKVNLQTLRELLQNQKPDKAAQVAAAIKK